MQQILLNFPSLWRLENQKAIEWMTGQKHASSYYYKIYMTEV